MINDPNLTSNLQPLEHRRRVGMLSLFYRYYHGACSDELSSLIPPHRVTSRETRSTTLIHPFAVDLKTMRTWRFHDSFLCKTARFWNDLPVSVFPSQFNPVLFKTNINNHLLIVPRGEGNNSNNTSAGPDPGPFLRTFSRGGRFWGRQIAAYDTSEKKIFFSKKNIEFCEIFGQP